MPDPAPALETTKVTITPGPMAAPDSFHVSQKADPSRLQVEWICGTSGFTVDFGSDSPFAQSRFSRSSPGSVLSGRVRDGVKAGDGHKYKYTLTVDGTVRDPDGEVDP